MAISLKEQLYALAEFRSNRVAPSQVQTDQHRTIFLECRQAMQDAFKSLVEQGLDHRLPIVSEAQIQQFLCRRGLDQIFGWRGPKHAAVRVAARLTGLTVSRVEDLWRELDAMHAQHGT